MRETAGQIEGTYTMLAIMAGQRTADGILMNPAFLIGPEKSMMIAKALNDVSKHYPIKTDGPQISILKLVGALAIVNVPIMMQLAQQRAQARANRARPATVAATPEAVVSGMTETRPPMDFTGDIGG